MQVIEVEIAAILQSLPQPALEEAKVFMDFLAWRYRDRSMENSESQTTFSHWAENDYTLLAQEGLRDVYDQEPDGLWEKCLEG